LVHPKVEVHEQLLIQAQGLIRHTHEEIPRLFDLSDEVKEKCNMIHSPSFLGYTRLGAETTAAKTDIREVRNLFTLAGLAFTPFYCF
jgi:isopenicillin N synthase-like dioxygenase